MSSSAETTTLSITEPTAPEKRINDDPCIKVIIDGAKQAIGEAAQAMSPPVGRLLLDAEQRTAHRRASATDCYLTMFHNKITLEA